MRTFDTLKIEVVPESVEFRRQIKFMFIEKIEKEETEEGDQSLADAMKSKKRRKK